MGKQRWKVLLGVSYFPEGVDPADPEAVAKHAEPGEIISDIKQSDGEGLTFYNALEEIVSPKVKPKESDA